MTEFLKSCAEKDTLTKDDRKRLVEVAENVGKIQAENANLKQKLSEQYSQNFSLMDKTESWSFGCKNLEGKYKGCKCTISFSSQHYSTIPCWYYVFTNTKTDNSYNSLWDNIIFGTQEECHNACVKKINQVLKDSENNG